MNWYIGLIDSEKLITLSDSFLILYTCPSQFLKLWLQYLLIYVPSETGKIINFLVCLRSESANKQLLLFLLKLYTKFSPLCFSHACNVFICKGVSNKREKESKYELSSLFKIIYDSFILYLLIPSQTGPFEQKEKPDTFINGFPFQYVNF